jgi:hypothetical protein
VELQTELREVCTVVTSLQTISRSLQQEGYTMKTVCCHYFSQSMLTFFQLTHPALEQNEHDHREFKALINMYFQPEQLVFADESHFNRLTLRRPHTWSKHGECATWYEFSFCGSKYLILPSISLDGVIHLEVLNKAINGNDLLKIRSRFTPSDE